MPAFGLRGECADGLGIGGQRLGDATGFPAQTLHRLLKLDSSTGKFKFNENNLLDYLKNRNTEAYQTLIERLGLRK